MKHARQVEPDFEPGPSRGGIVRTVVSLLVFALGAGVLALVLTGRLGASQTSYEDGSAEDGQQADAASLEPRESLADYSWAELSAISAEVSAASDRDAAIEVAASYNLVGADGTMTGDAKDVELSDGTTISVELADVLHDDRADGSGRAGLTFVTACSAGQHAMSSTGSVEGGWEASEMRSWLNSEMLGELPEDLADVIVPASKMTNNVGSTTDVAAVTATADSLWLLSAREVCGTIDWFGHEYGSGYAYYDDVCNAEGEQYALFSQAGVGPYTDPDGTLRRLGTDGTATPWFYRSAMNYAFEAIEGSFYYEALDSGYPYGHAAPETEQGVVFGFCV